jgi:hypothetical protein
MLILRAKATVKGGFESRGWTRRAFAGHYLMHHATSHGRGVSGWISQIDAL